MSLSEYKNDHKKLWAKDVNNQFIIKEIQRGFKCEKMFNNGITKSKCIDVYIVKAVDFPVVMHRYDSWTIKKGEHQRTDTFKLYCWRRLFRVPWTAQRSS